jgi:general secretion pathway protein C
MADGRPGLFHYDAGGETSPKRLAVLVGGGALVVLAALWLVGGDDGGDDGGDPAPVAVSAPPPAPAPPATTSPPPVGGTSVAELRLHGVMGTGDNGAAILSIGPGPQQLVRVGREAAPGIELLAVAGDHVLLREHGREVQLAFADDMPGSAAAPSASAPPAPAGDAPDRREILELQAALIPRREDGRHRGFEVREGALPAILADAGIQPGDILLRIAGNRLEDSDVIAEVPARLRQRGRLAVEIIRDGQEQTLFLEAP